MLPAEPHRSVGCNKRSALHRCRRVASDTAVSVQCAFGLLHPTFRREAGDALA
jgi:hypothetical protein